MAASDVRVDNDGVEWVTIHNPKIDGQAEITLAAWEEPTVKVAHDFTYTSFKDRGWERGPLPTSKSANTPAASGAGKEG